MDGLGGLPLQPGGPTELEAAHTPTLDRLATEGTLGQIVPVRTGITPGSGPAHLALFGIDPIEHAIGRGVIDQSAVEYMLYHQKSFAQVKPGRSSRSSSHSFGPATTRLDCFQNCTSDNSRSYQPLATMPWSVGRRPVT
jgi:hypothetical protein